MLDRAMGRVLIGAIVVAFIAAVIGFEWTVKQREAANRAQQEVNDLQQQLNRAQSDNNDLRARLGKLQEEESHLAAENNALNEAIAKSRLTGKAAEMPTLPYPPK
jgi:peptidoglycan hydrolase CwlO-like protein